MEFNDSSVSYLDYKKVAEDGFGGEAQSGGWSNFGSTFGKSAYMLVYERREKKPVKIVVEKDTEGSVYDAEKEESTKLISFKDASKQTGNCPIYQAVLEDNAKFEFENDLYSDEFFTFTTEILASVAQMEGDSAQLKKIFLKAEEIGRKVGLDIIAHCYDTKSLESLVDALKKIFDLSEAACVSFLGNFLKENSADYLVEILLDCSDGNTRNIVGDLIEHCLLKLRKVEKDLLLQDS